MDAAQEKTRRNTRSVPFKGVLEQVKRSADTDCNAQMMRRAFNAKKLCSWESFKEECRKEGKLCEWTLERLQETCDKVVALEVIGRLSIAQDILRKSTDFLRRSCAPVDGMGGVTLSHVCPHRNFFPLDDHMWWVSTGHRDGGNRKKKHCNWWCAACGGQHDWRAPNSKQVIQLGVNANEANVYRAHVAPLGLCK